MEKATVLAIQISAQQTEQAAAEGWSCVLKAVRQLDEARSQAEIAKSEAMEATRQLISERENKKQREGKTAAPKSTKQPGNPANAESKTQPEAEIATTR